LATDNLWPDDIGESDLVTPVSILREQAALLGPKTENLVTAEVRTAAVQKNIQHSFDLIAAALKYRYQLFTVTHAISLYPLTGSFRNTATRCANETDFRHWLASVFTSEKTKTIVKALIAQSRE
jgi:hypothetical protein